MEGVMQHLPVFSDDVAALWCACTRVGTMLKFGFEYTDEYSSHL